LVKVIFERVQIMQSQHIIDEIKKLPREELKSLFKWIEEYEQEIWDQEFEEDALSGNLDKLANRALDDFRSGKCKEL